MDTLDKYGFQNPLELIGIGNVYDIESLRKRVDSLIVQIKELLYEKNKPLVEKKTQELEHLRSIKPNLTGEELEKCESRIKIIETNLRNISSGREKWYQDFDRISTEVHSTNDPSVIIYQIVKLSDSYIRSLPVSSRNSIVDPNFKRVVHDLDSVFKNPGDVNRFLVDKAYVMQNIDFKKANLSRYEYFDEEKEGTLYVGAVKPNEDINMILDSVSDTGDRVQVFNIGRFRYGSIRKDNSEEEKSRKKKQTKKHTNKEDKFKLHYVSELFEVLTVLRKAENGDLRRYNGIMYFSVPIDYSNERFFTNTVFSDLVMQNAEKNNFGYIGIISAENESLKLDFNDIGVADTIKALSYCQKSKMTRCAEIPECKSLSQFYEIMNQKVMELTDLGEHPGSQPGNDEGGR